MRTTTIGIVMFILLVGIGATSHAQTRPTPVPSLVEQAQTLINNDKTATKPPADTGGDALSAVLDKLDQVIARGQTVTPTKASEPAAIRPTNTASATSDVPAPAPARVVADDNTELKVLVNELRDLVGQLREIVSRKN